MRADSRHDTASTATTVRSAGGVAWRPAANGVEVCVVHRPRYDDWTLPKGRLDPGESPLLAAVREVAEEADVRGVPQLRLPTVRYLSLGRPKVVDYWSMRAVGRGGFQPDTEVDEVRWLPVRDAVTLVSYPHDAAVLNAFAEASTVSATAVLLRTNSPEQDESPDHEGALDHHGRTRAHRLAPLAALVRPVRLLTVENRACIETLGPLAERLDLPVEVLEGSDPQDVASRLRAAASDGQPMVVCVPASLLARLWHLLGLRTVPAADADATGWLLAFSADRLVAADPLEH